MSIETYQQEQERMLRHKIGDELYNALDQWLNRGKHGMDTSRPGPSKVELQSLPQNGLRAKDSAKNEKPRARNNTLPYTY